MPNPIDFPERNIRWIPPAEMENVVELVAFVGHDEAGNPHIVSKWKFTPEEMEALQKNGGEFYVGLITYNQPPIYISTDQPFRITHGSEGDGYAGPTPNL